MITRRGVSKGILGSAGYTVLANAGLTVTATAARKKTRYAFLGLGFFASYVAPRVQASPHSEIKALISSDPAKAKEWADRYSVSEEQIYDYSQIGQLADNDEIDAVYIATPVGTHARFAVAALNAGKHVLVEKTMAASVEEATQMIEAARRNNRKLMVAYRARFEPFNREAIRYATEQVLGKVSSISAHKGFFIGDRLGKNSWRTSRALAGGGALVDIGVYSVQACRYIAGAEPLEVSAFIHNTPGDDRFREVEENLSFMMRFSDGILATGSASWGYALQNHYTVGAQRGSYRLAPASSNENLRMFVNTMQPRETTEIFLRNIDQIDAEFAHFSSCITNDENPVVPAEEGVRDLQVIEALYRSAKENRPISL